jgi:oligosaccharide translocation protein RFT1
LGAKGEEGNEGWAGGGVDWGLLGTVATMSMKAVFKFVLEKGEMFVLLQQFSPETWAMYGLVQNLASLVVRLVFLPVEDMSQLAFSKLLASGNHAAAADVLTVMVKLVVLIGSFAAAFGPAYSFTVVHLLYGSRWSSTEMPALLSWYSTYILFLALNGVTEAFVHASVSGAEMRRRSLQLVPVTAAYLGCACLFAPLVGARARMALRTILSLRHASALFAARGLPGALRIRELLPSPALIAVLAVCGSATLLVDRLFVGGKAAEISRIVLAGHVLAAVVCVAVCLLVQWKLDPGFVRRVKHVAVTRGKSE